MIPSNGRKALTWKMNPMLVLSANQPKKADPKPPKPNISPKNMPAIRPTLSGIRSVAYTTMEENAEAIISPDRNVQMMVHVKLTKGMAMAKGAAPKMENQMTPAKLVTQHTSSHCSYGKGSKEYEEAQL